MTCQVFYEVRKLFHYAQQASRTPIICSGDKKINLNKSLFVSNYLEIIFQTKNTDILPCQALKRHTIIMFTPMSDC